MSMINRGSSVSRLPRAIAFISAVALLPIQSVSAATYLFHNDHLGTPQALTSATQEVVWSRAQNSFGEGAPINNEVEMNLRYPGQYYDAETGLHQNYFRDYDPATGRYLESDPIGLNGGLSTYGYVGGNPLTYSDPSGLCFGLCIGAAAAVVVAHYSRNIFNESVSDISEVRDWREMSLDDSVFHIDKNGNNTKYISQNGHSEAVFDCVGDLVTNPTLIGTFNYFDPEFLWGGPHVIADILPYLVLGNTPSDFATTHRFEVVYNVAATKINTTVVAPFVREVNDVENQLHHGVTPY